MILISTPACSLSWSVRRIETEDGNVHAFLRVLDRRQQRSHTVGGFNDQLQLLSSVRRAAS
jgi:hypothetical protein